MESSGDRSAFRRWFASNFTLSPFYVFQGIYFFLRHRYMWSLLKTRLLPLTLLSMCIITMLFLTVYLPQVALLLLFHKRGSAFVNGAFLVLGEANLLIGILFESFLVDKTQVDSFDAVLVAKGHADLVRARRPVADEAENPVKSLGPREKGAIFAPFSFRQIIEFIVLLPLNFIPYAGVPLFLLLTGYRAGPLLQHRYHALLGLNKKERNTFVRAKSMKWQYTWFGTAYLMTQLVPVLSMLFLITGAAGSALWVAEMEDKKKEHLGSQPLPSDEPPAYTDEV